MVNAQLVSTQPLPTPYIKGLELVLNLGHTPLIGTFASAYILRC